jgi:uncharacterized membrane protein
MRVPDMPHTVPTPRGERQPSVRGGSWVEIGEVSQLRAAVDPHTEAAAKRAMWPLEWGMLTGPIFTVAVLVMMLGAAAAVAVVVVVVMVVDTPPT